MKNKYISKITIPSYTTTYTSGETVVIEPPSRTGDVEYINSPIIPISVETSDPNYAQGWVCPKCGRVNAPWIGCCSCQSQIKANTEIPIPSACKGCSNHPSNGGSGICNCTLGVPIITC